MNKLLSCVVADIYIYVYNASQAQQSVPAGQHGDLLGKIVHPSFRRPMFDGFVKRDNLHVVIKGNH
jgi:hypothetical protein